MVKCTYSQEIFSHSMSMHPESTRTGEIELSVRPMIGEEVQIDGSWEVIKKIQIGQEGLNLVLKPQYIDGIG